MKTDIEPEIEIVRWVIRPSGNKASIVAIGADGREFELRYYAEFGREWEPLNIEQTK